MNPKALEAEYIYQRFKEILTPHKVQLFSDVASERTRHLCVVLEDIFQEHNASAIIRTCDCLGIQDIYTIEERNRYVLQKKIALGAGRWVNLTRFSKKNEARKDCLTYLKRAGYALVVTSPHAKAYTPETLPMDKPVALFFGTEREGLHPETIAQADYALKIPMVGFTESLNLSVSVAVILSALRARLVQSELSWKITPEEQTCLKIDWSKKILNGGSALEMSFRKDYFEKEL